MIENRFKKNINGILVTTFVTGSADIVAAILWYALVEKQTTALKILQSIASGLFGMQAYRGGSQMALAGLLLHYFITLIFVSTYFMLYPTGSILRKFLATSGLIYGLLIWSIMNLLVLPFTFGSLGPVDPGTAVTGAAIIIFTMGLPISFMTRKYYQK